MLSERRHDATLGVCASCDRSWSQEEDGGGDCESWFAVHGVPDGSEDDELLTCPRCYRLHHRQLQ